VLQRVGRYEGQDDNISAFIPPDAVDPVYHAGGTYYLAPEGAVAQKPYALIHKP
jgi:non-homologous end joining protein Ku